MDVQEVWQIVGEQLHRLDGRGLAMNIELAGLTSYDRALLAAVYGLKGNCPPMDPSWPETVRKAYQVGWLDGLLRSGQALDAAMRQLHAADPGGGA